VLPAVIAQPLCLSELPILYSFSVPVLTKTEFSSPVVPFEILFLSTVNLAIVTSCLLLRPLAKNNVSSLSFTSIFLAVIFKALTKAAVTLLATISLSTACHIRPSHSKSAAFS
jgi:hypothetical protein